MYLKLVVFFTNIAYFIYKIEKSGITLEKIDNILILVV